MPMPDITPPNAVGYYVLIEPGRYWNGSFIERDYAGLGAKCWHESQAHGVGREQLLQAAVEAVVQVIPQVIDPRIQALPIEHPTRQELLRSHKTAVSILVYLKKAKFFVLRYADNRCHFRKLTATTIKQAQQQIMQLPEVQEIEKIREVSWQPITVH